MTLFEQMGRTYSKVGAQFHPARGARLRHRAIRIDAVALSEKSPQGTIFCIAHHHRLSPRAGTVSQLPQRKQLLNRYLNHVMIYPDYVQIHINKVPTNILTRCQG